MPVTFHGLVASEPTVLARPRRQEAVPSACRASPALPTLLARRFVVGYINQQFRLTFLWLSAGGGISAVVSAALVRVRVRVTAVVRSTPFDA